MKKNSKTQNNLSILQSKFESIVNIDFYMLFLLKDVFQKELSELITKKVSIRTRSNYKTNSYSKNITNFSVR